MTTRLKTVEYVFPTLGWAENNVVTNFEQITIYLPENNKTFISVTMDIFADDIITATGSAFNKRNMNLQLASNGYYANNNTILSVTSAENLTLMISGDYTSYFKTFWTGSSLTCDASVEFNIATGTPTGMRDITSKLTITYTYDDTSTTQVKTVWIPLNASNTHLATSKPGTANSTIPALDTWLPENSIDIKQMTIVIQGNDSIITATGGDFPVYMEIDGYGTRTTNNRVAALTSCRWYRYFWELDTGINNPSTPFDTSISHDFYIWTSIASRHGHLQCWMIVTYEYNDDLSDTILNSILLPMEIDSPFGGTTSDYSQKASRLLWIEEQTPITVKESALLVFYDTNIYLNGLNVRVNGGSWVEYTDATSNLAGGMGLMHRCETDLSLSRGKNTLIMDVYRTISTSGGFNASCLWMINYTTPKNPAGSGSHNHTVVKNIATTGPLAASVYRDILDQNFITPEEYVFYNAIGIHYTYTSNSTGNPAGVTIQAQREGCEGGSRWEVIYSDIGQTDPEAGIRQCFATARSVFHRFTGDVAPGNSIGNSRLNIRTARNYRAWLANSCTSWDHLDFIVTYHSITSTISGNITNYSGDGKDIIVDIFRTENNEYILSTTTDVGGSYSIKWFDDTAQIFAVSRQASVYVGRSDDAYAVLDNPS